MPTSFPDLSMMGMPPILFSRMILQCISDIGIASQSNRIEDQSAFTSFYLPYLVGLSFNGHVFMKDAQTAFACERHRKIRFGDGIHSS